MNKERILEIGKKLTGQTVVHGFHAQAAEIKNLISSVAGKNNPFYEAVDKVKILAHFSTDQLNSFIPAAGVCSKTTWLP